VQRAADGAHDWQTSSHIVWGGWGGAGGMCRPAVVLLRLRWWLSRSASWAHPEADTDVGAETASKSGCIALTENRFTQSSNTPGPRVEHTPEPLGRPGRQSGSPAIRGRSRQFAVTHCRCTERHEGRERCRGLPMELTTGRPVRISSGAAGEGREACADQQWCSFDYVGGSADLLAGHTRRRIRMLGRRPRANPDALH